MKRNKTLCESFPVEAIKANVLGAENVTREVGVKANQVKNVICLNTDKAAYPINTMGISKVLMGKIVISEFRNFSEGA